MTFTREELVSEEVELLPSRETLANWNFGNIASVGVYSASAALNSTLLGGHAWSQSNVAVGVSQSQSWSS